MIGASVRWLRRITRPGAVADGVAAIHTHVAGAVERVAHSYEGSRRAARRPPSSQRTFAPRPRSAASDALVTTLWTRTRPIQL